MKTILSLGLLALIAVTALACASGSGRRAPSKISTAADRAATASPEAIPNAAMSDESSAVGCRSSQIPALDPTYVENPRPRLVPYPNILDSRGRLSSVEEARASGFDAELPSSSLGERSLRLVLLDETADKVKGLRAYYATRPVTEADTIETFLVDGGVMVNEHVTIGNDAAAIKATIGEFANPVQIGPYEAALVWSDPIGGFRAYGLYWSDGSLDFELLGGVESPEMLVDFARSVYCG